MGTRSGWLVVAVGLACGLAFGLAFGLVGALGAEGRAQYEGRAECVVGTDGRVACGWHCALGSDGHAACADTADGACARDGRGDVVCTERRPLRRVDVNLLPPAECVRGSDGTAACGYGCERGRDGRVACAGTPWGRCAMRGDGSLACFDLGALEVTGEAREASRCERGRDGQVACGWACARGGDGGVRCADTPSGACVATNASAVCSRLR